MIGDIEVFLDQRQIDARTFANLRLAELEFEAGATEVASHPNVFSFATTTHCNLKCVMCDHGNDVPVYRAHLDTSIIPRLSDFVSQVRSVELFGLGEPMMSPSFWTALELLAPIQGLHIGIHTNGTLLDLPRIERLLSSPLTQINVSLDAARPATYAKIRGGSFKRVVEGVRNLVRRRNERGEQRLRIILDMILMRENIEELPEFIDLAADLGVDQVSLWHLHDTPKQISWHTRRGAWEFVYKEQLLKLAPKLANRMIAAAIRRAGERNVNMHWDVNKSLMLEEGN